MFNLVSKDDSRLLTYKDSTVYKGNPDGLYFAKDVKGLSDFVGYCFHHKIPITPCGSRTAMTGASQADSGYLLAFEKMDCLLDIATDPVTKTPIAICEPGILLGDLKRKVEEAGFFYPPDPTSYKEAQLGGTVATNATGEDSFLYGPTRRYIRELQIVTADGQTQTLKRKTMPAMTTKNKAGYFLDGEEIDYLIGSEGTLGIITQITVDLIKPPFGFFALLIPFKTFDDTLNAVEKLSVGDQLNPRAIELIGPGAFEIFCEQKEIPQFPDKTTSLLYVKQEYISEADYDKKLSLWLEVLQNFYEEHGCKGWEEYLFVAKSDKEKEALRAFRHYIPQMVNERNRKFLDTGGGKISTDWWVPPNKMKNFMLTIYDESIKQKIPFLVFAHIGNGHPHWNYLTRDNIEKARIEKFVEDVCRRAVGLGGGVAGEHGVGKIHHNYLEIQHNASVVQKMLALKKKWDPSFLLGRGNIFPGA
ncbi:FAD-binding oxidoreductase [bacterium]|nr:FAD-binding oxidoreductase [bacterium]